MMIASGMMPDEVLKAVIDHVGFVSVVSDAVDGDVSRARDLIGQTINQLVNIYEYSHIDRSLIGNDREKFVETLRVNLDESVSDAEFDALKMWIDCAASKTILEWAGSIMSD